MNIIKYAAGRHSDRSVMERNKNPLIPLCQVAAAGNLSFEVQKSEMSRHKPRIKPLSGSPCLERPPTGPASFGMAAREKQLDCTEHSANPTDTIRGCPNTGHTLGQGLIPCLPSPASEALLMQCRQGYLWATIHSSHF